MSSTTAPTGAAGHSSVGLAAAAGLEERSGLDRLAALVSQVAETVVPSGRAHDELRGRSLGHPLHAVLTDLPLGLWAGATVLDLTGPVRHAGAARRLIGLGVLAAVPTVLAGLADYGALSERARRVAAAHAAVNGVGNALFATSWVARRRGRPTLGIMLSVAGMTAAGAGAFLGGHIAGRLQEPAPVPR
jgi:uncharacterized membrane protein